MYMYRIRLKERPGRSIFQRGWAVFQGWTLFQMYKTTLKYGHSFFLNRLGWALFHSESSGVGATAHTQPAVHTGENEKCDHGQHSATARQARSMNTRSDTDIWYGKKARECSPIHNTCGRRLSHIILIHTQSQSITFWIMPAAQLLSR